jgi:Uma2 family endonuclease
MKSGTLVPLSEYLATAYRPDMDYLEGRLMERNVGEIPHSRWQAILSAWFNVMHPELGFEALPELRVQVKAERFRVPDVTVVRDQAPQDGYLTEPPFLAIEILSRDDRMTDIEQRVADYLAFGVPHVWVISPLSQKAYVATQAGLHEALDGVLTAGPIRIALAELAAHIRR